jgi:hypothetical protein
MALLVVREGLLKGTGYKYLQGLEAYGGVGWLGGGLLICGLCWGDGLEETTEMGYSLSVVVTPSTHQWVPPHVPSILNLTLFCFISCLLWLCCRYRSLAGQCTRALRLDLLLLVAHHMLSLGGSSHICDEEDAKDVHPAMGALTR